LALSSSSLFTDEVETQLSMDGYKWTKRVLKAAGLAPALPTCSVILLGFMVAKSRKRKNVPFLSVYVHFPYYLNSFNDCLSLNKNSFSLKLLWRVGRKVKIGPDIKYEVEV
jgi:hypothetical protein